LTSLVIELLGSIASLIGGLLRGVRNVIRLQATRSLRQLAQLLGGLLRGLGNGGGHLLSLTIRLLAGRIERGLGLLHHRIRFQRAGHLGPGFPISLACSSMTWASGVAAAVLASWFSFSAARLVRLASRAASVLRAGSRIPPRSSAWSCNCLLALVRSILRFLGRHQALLVSLLLGGTFRVLGELSRLVHRIARLLSKEASARILPIRHGFAELLRTAVRLRRRCP